MPKEKEKTNEHRTEQKELLKSSKTNLYRAVGADEFSSIIRTKQFAVLEHGLQVKHFGLDYSETLCFADKDFNIDVVAILEVEINSALLKELGDFTHVDTFIFRSGTVEIRSDRLSEFNNAILKITHKS